MHSFLLVVKKLFKIALLSLLVELYAYLSIDCMALHIIIKIFIINLEI